ncbi:hypothetical protein [Endozoicomonas sp. ALB122]|uniref:hypothetical protein n=1 Tax=Endozoicomonas sp. ALB122 TaxID=3403075 RepID=UPI003BB68C30
MTSAEPGNDPVIAEQARELRPLVDKYRRKSSVKCFPEDSHRFEQQTTTLAKAGGERLKHFQVRWSLTLLSWFDGCF